MVDIIMGFIKDEEGLGTVEMVLLIAVLVGLALIFKDSVIGFVKKILEQITGQSEVFDPGSMGD